MNNQLHKVYSDLYDELNPDFKKYWCVASNVRILLPPFFKTKKQVTFRNRYNLMSEHEIMEIINDTIDGYFPGTRDRHVEEVISYFNQDYDTYRQSVHYHLWKPLEEESTDSEDEDMQTSNSF